MPRQHSSEDSCSHSVVKRVVRDFSGHPVYKTLTLALNLMISGNTALNIPRWILILNVILSFPNFLRNSGRDLQQWRLTDICYLEWPNLLMTGSYDEYMGIDRIVYPIKSLRLNEYLGDEANL
ncbi:hypothetical protein AVEN_263847-1 [Araneus ventricosus]|uniref:Uncharacterized protein n=1 Tax=Araneus ventricosus TaxID=182803 RepID=A0A4Y2E0Z0_ARAVE|nr:hypothetical protein AVEN_263847-1 [Araneus ventricosus]